MLAALFCRLIIKWNLLTISKEIEVFNIETSFIQLQNIKGVVQLTAHVNKRPNYPSHNRLAKNIACYR